MRSVKKAQQCVIGVIASIKRISSVQEKLLFLKTFEFVTQRHLHVASMCDV
jgi:hypothetical protein